MKILNRNNEIINKQVEKYRRLMEFPDNPLLARGRISTIDDVNEKADKLILENKDSIKDKVIK
ncbi:MAG: hypothetical protein LUG16_07375, partial [Candidatus Gastranaerophilales bacterium]|nr:hypothetical protein [Candidatus Gastranaerophilales bacterium]